jgi:hypothetical protein
MFNGKSQKEKSDFDRFGIDEMNQQLDAKDLTTFFNVFN